MEFNTTNTTTFTIIFIIIFAIWYYLSKNYIYENIKISCETNIDNSTTIFWGVIIRYIISIAIVYSVIFGYSYFTRRKE